MPYCPQCGSLLNTTNAPCPSCPSGGSVINRAAAPASSAGLAPNLAGLLCYLLGFVTGIIFLVIEPYRNDSFVRFHAFQSIFFNIAWIGFWIAWGIAFAALRAITGGILELLAIPIDLIVAFAGLAVWLWLMYRAWLGERYALPYIGPLAARQAGVQNIQQEEKTI